MGSYSVNGQEIGKYYLGFRDMTPRKGKSNKMEKTGNEMEAKIIAMTEELCYGLMWAVQRVSFGILVRVQVWWGQQVKILRFFWSRIIARGSK